MANFVSLADGIDPYVEGGFPDLPEELQVMWKERVSLFQWDELTAGQRIEIAKQQDYQQNPSTEAERQAAFDTVTAVYDLQRQIVELEVAATPTALDVIAREDRLKLLHADLAGAQERMKHLRGDYTDTELVATVVVEDGAPEASSKPICSAGLFGPADFDPLPTGGIAKIFRLYSDETANANHWKSLAKAALRNGLIASRLREGKGKAQSSFNPCMVGDWLVAKGLMPRERVDRILANNLPPRSAHLRDLFAS